MPVIIPDKLPAREILARENIFAIEYNKAIHQDIRPLKVLILNIMPNKEATETQILRLLTNSPLQVEIQLIHPLTHESKNSSRQHLDCFYKTFNEIKDDNFDGLIVTGAPVEHLEFKDVDYWNEIKEILDWSEKHGTASLFICWAAQAALYHFYGIPKHQLSAKMSGIFSHKVNHKNSLISRGFDEVFYAPHSRHTEVRSSDILQHAELEIISESEEAGIYIVASKDRKKIFVTGHPEYDRDTLKNEYERDIAKYTEVKIPKHYFPGDKTGNSPENNWRSHANLLYINWLNYYVYQITPFDLHEVGNTFSHKEPNLSIINLEIPEGETLY